VLWKGRIVESGGREAMFTSDNPFVRQFLAGAEEGIMRLAEDREEKSAIDANYEQLKWALRPLGDEDDRRESIVTYLQNTHGTAHNRYKMEVKNVFELNRRDKVEQKCQIGNKKLLWHGSKLTNFFGILSQGLRIAPPEAPVTGYMFGKGVYFADMSSKSANYAQTGSNRTGLMLLSEVDIGEPERMFYGDCEMHTKLPKGKHSVMGVGRNEPSLSEKRTIDGIEVVCGPPLINQNQNCSLVHNEYIVYDLAQIRERFLVEFDFNWTR